MPTKSPPAALEPYLRFPPETSLTLLTSTLGCSVNWLTARFIGSALQNFSASSTSSEAEQNDAGREVAVLLVSWMRDLKFWQDEVRRVAGIDISKPVYFTRFAFVDCFNATTTTTTPTTSTSTTSLLSATQSSISTAISKNFSSPTTTTTTEEFQKQQQQQRQNNGPKILLILDQPDLLLATHHPTLTSPDLSTLLLNLRSHSQIHATYLSLSADGPLIVTAAASQLSSRTTATPLETESSAFIITQAHLSRAVLSVRELETGAAKDVSGVLRITRGGEDEAGNEDENENEAKNEDEDERDNDKGEIIKEAELLYLLQRDGGLKVFQRGE